MRVYVWVRVPASVCMSVGVSVFLIFAWPTSDVGS